MYYNNKYYSIDDLLMAGINYADNVVVLNKESETFKTSEEDMSDCNTIVAVQTVFKQVFSKRGYEQVDNVRNIFKLKQIMSKC